VIIEILRNLFPSQTKTYLIPVTESITAVLRPVKSGESAADFRRIARTIVDTLNVEALSQIQISYSSVIETLGDISRAFRETSLALKVGRLFYSEQNIFPYDELGIGRLIHQLPPSLCEMFLKEVFENGPEEKFEEEELTTVYTFFDNNLNISETARQLYVHRNTLVYRLEKIQKKTGLDVRVFDDALTFKIAMMVADHMKDINEKN
uniref:PucR family transcriptional regulator n=1 Tax=Merdimonas faecis TaxID=1653435 RepID=UPI0032086947